MLTETKAQTLGAQTKADSRVRARLYSNRLESVLQREDGSRDKIPLIPAPNPETRWEESGKYGVTEADSLTRFIQIPSSIPTKKDVLFTSSRSFWYRWRSLTILDISDFREPSNLEHRGATGSLPLNTVRRIVWGVTSTRVLRLIVWIYAPRFLPISMNLHSVTWP